MLPAWVSEQELVKNKVRACQERPAAPRTPALPGPATVSDHHGRLVSAP
jgi:hypothetical protein